MSTVCKKCGWVMANPDWGCLDCAWQEYNKLKEKIGEKNE
jgi:predicted  nucleic acid-binding Zn-ribbon protein